MNEKGRFNQAAQGENTHRARRAKDLQRERDEKLEALNHEQMRRHAQDMDSARRQILLAHSRPECRPSYAQQKPLSSEQLEKQARRMVEAQNLRESNLVREHYRHEIVRLDNPARQESGVNRKDCPPEIRTHFNGFPSGREGRETGRAR